MTIRPLNNRRRYFPSRRLIACCALLCFGADAAPGAADAIAVPDSLAAPAVEKLLLRTHARGVQIYRCQPSKEDPLRFAWVFAAPQANLFGRGAKKLAKHYAGPTWQANDGSTVVGEVVAHDEGPDPDAIPWLLLSAKSTSGKGTFAAIRSIQRLRTHGGKAPAAGCDSAHADREVRVPYTADYWFYVAK